MDELERLESQLLIAKNRIGELQAQLAATQQQNLELVERLTLTSAERRVLAGHDDGCIRVGEIRPIVRRVFGDAA